MMLRREQEIKSTAQRPDDFHIVSGQAPVYRVVEYPIALQLRGGRMMRLIKMRLKLRRRSPPITAVIADDGKTSKTHGRTQLPHWTNNISRL